MTIGRVGLSKVINKDYVTTIQKMAVKAGGSQSSTSSSATNWSSTLQTGARIYANSVSALNSLISYLNVSKDTLTGLLDLTDGMIELCEKAKKPSTGNQTRKRLDAKYNELVKKFKDIVEKSDESERNILTKDGLTKLFSIIGLDTETSKTIAEVFGEFFFEGDNEILASEDIMPTKQPIIPRQAYGVSKGSEYTMGEVTGGGGSSVGEMIDGVLSTYASVSAKIIDDNNVISFVDRNTNEERILGNDGFQYTLQSVARDTGYAVVNRYVDDSTFSAMLLVDNEGNVVKEISQGDGYYTHAAISDDGKSILYSQKFNDEEHEVFVETLNLLTFDDYENDGNLVEVARKDGYAELAYQSLKINQDGSYFTYWDDEVNEKHFVNSETLERDLDFTVNNYVIDYDFVNKDTLVVYDDDDILTYKWGSGEFNMLVLDAHIGVLDALREDENGVSYVAYSKAATNDVKVITLDGEEVYSYEGAQGDEIKNISLVYNTSNKLEVGIFGKLQNISGSSEDGFYRYKQETTKRYVSSTKALAKVFDKSYNLKTMADAYRTENALKALKDQIETNIATMDEMYEVVGQNLDLVRGTGFALLDISQEVLTSDTAETIARKLRKQIIKNASKALSQADNLEPLAIASMMLNDEI